MFRKNAPTFAILILGTMSAELTAQDVTLTRVKYDELARYVAAQKGKVVVVDFWATWCVPCKKAFPHLVALHQKYRKQDLVVLAVCLDDPKDERATAAAKQFLAQQKAAMTTVLLDETAEVWQKKLRSESIPLVFVFNRAGQIEQRWSEVPKPEAVEALVEKLLAQKGMR